MSYHEKGSTQNNVLLSVLIGAVAVFTVLVGIYFFSEDKKSPTENEVVTKKQPVEKKVIEEAKKNANPTAEFKEVGPDEEALYLATANNSTVSKKETYLTSVEGDCPLESCTNVIAGIVQSVNENELTIIAVLEGGDPIPEEKRLSITLPENIIIKHFNITALEYLDGTGTVEGDNIEISLDNNDEIVSATVIKE